MTIMAQATGNSIPAAIDGDTPVILDFWADWCGPCRKFASTMEQLARKHPEWRVVGVDVEANAELAQRFGVMGVPALHVVSGGQPVGTFTGAAPLRAVEHFVSGSLGR